MSYDQNYLKMYPDVAADPYYGSRPLEHYRTHGSREGRTWGAMPQPPASPGGPSMSNPLPPLATVTKPAPPMSTPTPPSQWTAPQMSTNTPPLQYRTTTTGGNTPPMSGGLPALSMPTAPTLPGINGNQFIAQPNGPANSGDVGAIIRALQAQFGPGNRGSGNDLVQNAVSGILNQGNPYISRARSRALDFASQRGMLNSSMAAGAAEGAAIDAAMPLIQESLGITNRREGEDHAMRSQGFGASTNLLGQREQQNFQGQQNQLDRVQGVNNALLANQLAERQASLADYYSRGQMVLDGQIRQRIQADSAAQQDWLSNNQYTREFNGALAMMPIRNAYDMANAIQQYALREPEVYTPQVISGMTNFFQQNMLSILSKYFPNLVQGGG